MLINTLAGVHESAVLVRPNGLLEFINPAAEKLLKYKVRSARGKHFTELFSLMEANTRQVIPWLERVQLTPHEKLSTQVAILHTTSIGDLQVLFSVQKAHYAESDVSAWLLLIRDQTELNALQLRLDYLEQHDPQTLLLNRKSFELRLKLAIEQVQRHGIKHSFCLISMDQFKIINDSMGHNAGDVLIERISRILKEEIDSRRDLLARLGGDEFGILFGENEPSMSLRSAERIRQRLEQYAFEWNKTRHNISSSIAFVPIYKGLNTPNRILSVADAACRVAKSKGGNRIHLYKPNDQDVLKQRGHMVWLGRLKKAFEAGNFKLVAQPIHPLNAVEFQHAFHHYETLIRLYDENNQPVPYGKEGKVVITSLYNKAHPFIRYEIGDVGILNEKSTPKKPILKKLIGRTSDVALLPSGKKSPGLTFYYVTKSIIEDDGNVKEFIVRQTKLDSFEIDYVSSVELTSEQIQEIEKAIAKYLEPGLHFTYNRKEVLKRTARGKLKQFQSSL